MLFDFAAVLIFIVLGCLFVFGSLLIGRVVRPNRPNIDKNAIYECGEPTIGSAWIRFNSRFYNIALVYLLFDVEVVVLVPALLVLREMKALPTGAGGALVGLLAFIGLLALGLAYEWYYGNLDWIRQADAAPEQEGPGPEKEAEPLREIAM